jgi:hypothetical protein
MGAVHTHTRGHSRLAEPGAKPNTPHVLAKNFANIHPQ